MLREVLNAQLHHQPVVPQGKELPSAIAKWADLPIASEFHCLIIVSKQVPVPLEAVAVNGEGLVCKVGRHGVKRAIMLETAPGNAVRKRNEDVTSQFEGTILKSAMPGPQYRKPVSARSSHIKLRDPTAKRRNKLQMRAAVLDGDPFDNHLPTAVNGEVLTRDHV